jgi:hypothetical protein
MRIHLDSLGKCAEAILRGDTIHLHLVSVDVVTINLDVLEERGGIDRLTLESPPGVVSGKGGPIGRTGGPKECQPLVDSPGID